MARRFRQWPSVAVTLFAAILSAVAVRSWWDSRAGTSAVSLAPGTAEILGVIDGNTLLVAQGQAGLGSHATTAPVEYRVRLLGVEVTSPQEPAAAAHLAAIAPPGPARIELDKRRIAVDGSWLAYVYVGQTLVNAQLIARGQARYEAYPGDSQPIGRQLRQAQQEAARAGRGP